MKWISSNLVLCLSSKVKALPLERFLKSRSIISSNNSQPTKPKAAWQVDSKDESGSLTCYINHKNFVLTKFQTNVLTKMYSTKF